MYQQSPKHQLINRLNNACIKLTCAYIILHHVKFILYKKCNIWHWYKEHPQTTHYYVLKIIVHISFETVLLEHMTSLFIKSCTCHLHMVTKI